MKFAHRHHMPAMLALAAVVVTGCSGSVSNADKPTPGPTATLHGVNPNLHLRAPNVTLTTTDGKPFNFADAAVNKTLLVYFGYTHCPDECPTTMADVASALRRSPSWVRSGVTMAFVTTDPKRDRPAELRAWLDNFSPSFIGLTGTEREIAAAEKAMHVPAAEKESAEPADHVGKYGVNHTTVVLAFSHGVVVSGYPTGVTSEDYAADLKVLVATDRSASTT